MNETTRELFDLCKKVINKKLSKKDRKIHNKILRLLFHSVDLELFHLEQQLDFEECLSRADDNESSNVKTSLRQND